MDNRRVPSESINKQVTNKLNNKKNGTMKYLNCNQTVFLIEFLYQYPDNFFICQKNGLMEVLKNEDKNGIKSIKIFDPAKNKFTVCSKKKILELMSYDTEFIEFSKKHYYFK